MAVLGPSGRRTYGGLCADAARFGHGFRALGLAPGDRILLFLDDTAAYPAAFFGALRAGFVPLLINTMTPPDLLQFYLQDSGARIAVTDAAFAHRFNTAACTGTALETILVVNGPCAGELAAPAQPMDALFASQAAELAPLDTHRNDMAFWMYSSGSTGRPKGIVHLHHDMAYTARSYADHILAPTPDDVCFSVPKIFFAYRQLDHLPVLGRCGERPASRSAEAGNDLRNHRPPSPHGVLRPAYALHCAHQGAGSGKRRFRVAAPVDIGRRDPLGGGLRLGSTEVLHIYLSNTRERKKLGAAGRRDPGYELQLCNADGQPVKDGEEGVLSVRGDSNTPFYWNRPDKTAETMRGDGWIYTGDRFMRDADGFYFFRGRADDLVKVSGQWVYPLEVELCLAAHPSVRECAIVAVELPDRRVTLKAFVVMDAPQFDPGDTTRRLQEHVKQTLLPYKYPRIVEYMAELPKTGTGKIDRQALLKAPVAVTDATPKWRRFPWSRR